MFYCSVAGLSMTTVKWSRAMIWAVRAKSNRFWAYQGVFSTLVNFFWANSVKVVAIFELKHDAQRSRKLHKKTLKNQILYRARRYARDFGFSSAHPRGARGSNWINRDMVPGGF